MSIRNIKHKRTKFGQVTTGRLLAVAAMLCLTANGASAQADHKTLFFISDSHLDTQWNWDVRTTIGEYVHNTMTQNFPLLDKYPYFNFNFEGAIKYRWMKEYWPSDYAKLKKYIASGRWHVSGCCVDANDVMTTSAESIMRNWLYGSTFFQKEFGVRGGHDVMLPDCFGFSYALPSLAHHCGMTGFHTAKLAWGSSDYGQLPDWGLWQGVDGSQIYAVYKPGAYDSHEDYNHDLTTDARLLSEINNNYSNYGTAVEIRYVGPRSDHGGGLHDNASSSGYSDNGMFSVSGMPVQLRLWLHTYTLSADGTSFVRTAPLIASPFTAWFVANNDRAALVTSLPVHKSDGTATGITDITGDALDGHGPVVVYAVSGVRVAVVTDKAQLDALPRGVYIIRGRKVICGK